MPKHNKVLLIEDEVSSLKIYTNKLKKSGFEVSMATTGDEGLRKAHTEKPDLILLDLILPVKNGFLVLEELKSKEETKDIPVVVLSNLGQESDINNARNLGAVEYIIKTNKSLTELIDIVKKYINNTD